MDERATAPQSEGQPGLLCKIARLSKCLYLGAHTATLEAHKGQAGRSGSRDPSQDTPDPQERGGETLEVPTEAKQTEIPPGSSACWT